ncbi:glutathione S-transferase family protein [Halovulum dunhuangense]|uniref:Glutathione S-transferase family protein n=1 Tax=Halovulum dunhuangense TaxID=1505036 RepID=A0A849L4R6_9RHOB|nr:glutathione S-transferase family protein [Halovulum dunhuangense]NNU81190.1 glutathione S-transferase family protein [Halovulum dunhuangense]
MSIPVLHCFAQSGNAYKAAMMLDLCNAPWEPAFVDFFNGAARGPDYMALNEMAEVPTYVEGDLRLTQSGVILDYLAARHGRFAPDGEAERREVLRWLLWDNHKLTANLASARFMRLFLAERHRKPDVIDFLMGRARAAMKVLDRRLQGQDWILGDRPSIADLSCAGYIWFLEEIDIDPADTPGIARWRDRIAALPGWRHPYEAMPGHPLPGAA